MSRLYRVACGAVGLTLLASDLTAAAAQAGPDPGSFDVKSVELLAQVNGEWMPVEDTLVASSNY